MNKYNLTTFNVLVADCEGFLERFFDENPNFYDNLVIFEADGGNNPDGTPKCDYSKITNTLISKGFEQKNNNSQNVWLR
jgi:hypothetical protein